MTKREKVLATLVGGTVALLVNWFLIDFFSNNHRTLTQDLVRKENQLKSLQTLIADKGLWEQRAALLDSTQPKLVDPAGSGVRLMEEVREMAKRHEVMIAPETLVIGTPTPKDQYISVPITVETKSSWKALVEFLKELQGPEKFIAVEKGSFKINSADQTKMQGNLTIAKWYAPK